MRHHFKNSIHRVAGARGLFHFALHAGFGVGIDAGEHDLGFGGGRRDLVPCGWAVKLHAPHADDVAEDFNPHGPQHQLGQRPCGHARCGLASRGPLQHIARVGKVVLECSG